MFQRLFGKNEKQEVRSADSNTTDTGTVSADDGLTAVPKDTLGLHILWEPPDGNAKIDIVAVHGLGGNAYSTWSHSNGVLWLRDLLPTALKDVRIMTYGYDVGMITKARTERTFTFGEALLTELRDLRSGPAKTRPLFFIAHSLGGIVVKKVLIIANNRPTQYGDIINSTRHLMFFGTPHQGTTSIAGFMQRLGAALSSDGSVLRELELWSPEVLETNSFFLTEIAPMFTITSFFERQKIAGVQIVDEGSARLHQTHEDVIGLDADHRNMCKFQNAEDNKYIKTLRRLQAEIANLKEHPLDMKDERIKDLLKNNELGLYLESLNAAQFRLHAERWVTQEYRGALKREFREWINPPTFDDGDFLKHYSKLTKQHNESAEWIFQQRAFHSWQSGDSKLLWVCGRPGCGKSVLASKIVHYLQHLSSTPERPAYDVLYAFSDKQDESKKYSASLVRTILWQLMTSGKLSISQQLEIISDCRRASRAEGGQTKASTDDRFAYMSDLLKKYIQMLPVIVVVDGLDECYDPDLLASLSLELQSAQLSETKIWISSQKTQPISRFLDAAESKIDMEDHLIRILTNNDIRQYIRTQFLATQSAVIQANVDEIAETLVSKANGMFLWAAVSIPEVQAKAELVANDLAQLRRSIDDLPANLEETFLYLLNRILRPLVNLGAPANEQRRMKLVEILRWSFHALRPLTVKELDEATNIITDAHEAIPNAGSGSSQDIAALLKSLYPLIYVSGDTAHIMHATFRNFVLPSYGIESSDAIIEIFGSQSFQSELARQCIVYLGKPHFKDFLSLSSQSDTIGKFPFLNYAISSWITHLMNDPAINTGLKVSLDKFLSSNQAITWLEQYMVSGKEPIVTLQSRLYSKKGYVEDLKWILKILIDDVKERMIQEPNSAKTEEMTDQLGGLYWYHGMAKDAAKIYEKIYRKQKLLIEPNPHKLQFAINRLALVRSDLGQYAEAKRLMEELINSTSVSGDQDSYSAIAALNNLGTIYARLGDSSKAADLAFQHLVRTRAMFGDHSVETALSHNNLGSACLIVGRNVVAKEHLQRAANLLKELQGKDSDRELLALENLAVAESALGNVAEALKLSEYVWKTRKGKLGEEHPTTIGACKNYCAYLYIIGRIDETVTLVKEQVRLCQKALGSAHPMTLAAQGNLAEVLDQLGRYRESIALAQRTLEARKRVLGNFHPETLLSMQNYANTLRKEYNFEQATRLLVDCINLCYQTFGQYHDFTISALRSLSDQCMQQNRFSLAAHLALRALDLSKATHADDHPTTLLSETFYASALRDLGHYDEAEARVERVVRLTARAAIEDTTLVLNPRIVLSSIHRLNGNFEASLEIADRLVEEGENRSKEGKLNKSWFLQAWEQQALVLGKLGRYEEALALMQRVYAGVIENFGSESNARLPYQCNLALCYLDVGDIQTAQDLTQPVLEIWTKILGKAHSRTAMAMITQAKCYRVLGKYPEAKALISEAAAIRHTLLGPKHMLTLRTRHEYAKTLFKSGDLAAADVAMSDVLRDELRYLAMDHPHGVESAACLEEIRAELGSDPVSLITTEPDESDEESEVSAKLQLLKKAFEEAQIVFGMQNSEVLILHRELAVASTAATRTQDAASSLRQVWKEQIELQSSTHPETITTLLELLKLTEGEGKDEKMHLSQAVLDMIRTRSSIDLRLFRKILGFNPDMTIPDPESGYTALAYATYRNELDLVRCLLVAGVDVDALQSDGKTCLHIAVAARYPETVQLLVDNKANPNILDIKQKQSPLYLASAKGYTEIARILLTGSANPNLSEAVPALVAAAGYNRHDIVDLLLQNGADIEIRNSSGFTSLLNSIDHGHLSMVQLLHKKGAKIDAVSNAGDKALSTACWKGSKPIVEFLIGLGQDVNEYTCNITPLHRAAEGGFWEIMEVLMQAGAQIDAKGTTEPGWTPLVNAAWAGRAIVVEKILEMPGQSPNGHFGPMQVTPLHWAASRGHADVVEKLLKAGADINAVTVGGLSALIEAVRNGHTEVVEILLKAGANTELVSGGYTAFTLSLIERKAEVAEAVIRHATIDFNAHIFGSMTPLYLAIYCFPVSTVKLLLGRGADPNIHVSSRQHYPLQLAVELRERAHMQALLAHGADQSVKDIHGCTAIDAVNPDDEEIRSLFNDDFCTPLPDQIAEAKNVITQHAVEILTSLQSDESHSRQALHDKLENMAQAFRKLDAKDDSMIALEQCITWQDAAEGRERTLEHSMPCSGCRGLSGIVGQMYICSKCPFLGLCTTCFKGHQSGEKPFNGCIHDAAVYMYHVVPRSGWAELDAQGLVSKDPETGNGTTLIEWLTETSQRYRDRNKQTPE